MRNPSRSFFEWMEESPCDGCPAPCCRLHLSPAKVPETVTDLDYLRYSLLFPGNELLVGADGSWMLARWQECSALEPGSCSCSLHATPAKPQVCVHFNPYNCWYKRNFTTAEPPDLYRLDRARFELWVESIGLDEDGLIVSAPPFEEAREMLRELPVAPVLQPGIVPVAAVPEAEQP